VRFDIAPELRLFGESVCAAVGAWDAPREPDLGEWLDDRDAELAARLAAAGWSELWTAEPEAVVAGALELGRAIAPICTVDEATLNAPLSVAGRIRHGAEAETCVLPLPGWGLALGRPTGERTRERTLDGSGTVRTKIEELEPLDDAAARWSAWTCATLAYVAGLAAAALEATVEHARAREQFGLPLAALPAIQARLADASLNVDGLELVAWNACAEAANPESRTAALLWAGRACRDVTLSAHQIHGAVGFALETGLHRYYRRAKSVQVWAAADARECA
jgi:Acyl-CoA dehydrogenase, C-terminal domain